MMHHTIEKMIKLTTIITPMTGHLQYVAAMQLSQLEKAFLTSLTWFPALVTVSVIPRFSMFAAKLDTTEPNTPPRRLLAMATSIEGIFECYCFPVFLFSSFPPKMNVILDSIPTK